MYPHRLHRREPETHDDRKQDAPPHPYRAGQGREPAQADSGEKAQRRIKEVDMPPPIINVGVQQDHGGNGRREARNGENLETHRPVAEHVSRTAGGGRDRAGRSDQRQNEHRRRRSDRHPDGDVVRRNVGPADALAQEKGEDARRVLGKDGKTLEESKRVRPQGRKGRVENERARQGKGAGGRQDALPFVGVRSAGEIARPHGEDDRDQYHAEYTDVGEQPDSRSAEQERPDRILRERPVQEKQAGSEQTEKGYVLGIEE